MSLINRYIIRHIIQATLMVMFIFIGVDIFVELANEMRFLGRGQYHIWQALQYVPMILPGRLYGFFPMIGLVGSLVGLSLLSSTCELTIIRASGVSRFAICRSVILSALFIAIFVGLMGEVVAPKLDRQAEYLKKSAMFGEKSVEVKNGVWLHVNNDFFRVGTVFSNDDLRRVVRYLFDDQHRLVAAYVAGRLTYHEHAWRARNVRYTKFFDDHTETDHVGDMTWDIDLNPKVLSFGSNDPMIMSMPELTHYIKYREGVGLSSNAYKLAYWQRIYQPLATLIMILLAMPFVFGSSRSGTMGYRVMMGLVLGLSFYLMNQFAGQVSLVYQVPPVLSALIPIVVFAAIGFLLMLRVK